MEQGSVAKTGVPCPCSEKNVRETPHSILVVRDALIRDHEEMGGLGVSVRASAVSLAVSGFVVAVALPWHPTIFDRPVDLVVKGFGPWSLLHVVLIFAVILALIGASGLVAAHEGCLGLLGQVGLNMMVVGVVLVGVLAGTEAVAFPVLAVRAPILLSIDGPLLRSPLLIGAGILALGWPLGLALLGLAAARSGIFGRMPGVLLAISGPLFLGLEGPFLPVAGVLSAVVFGLSQIWWGWLLWRRPGATREIPAP